MSEQAAAPHISSPSLASGTVVGGRFVVDRVVHQDPLGWILAAKDKKTNRPITLRVLAAGLITDAVSKTLRKSARVASSLSHSNIVATYGVGTTPTKDHFVACEWIDGTPLSRVIEREQEAGRGMSLRGAYNVIAHLCRALTYAQPHLCHGTLRPSAVWIGASGAIKVGDFGVGKTIVEARGAAALGTLEQACLAPEIKLGKPATAASDIFGLGAILYQLLTGRSPADGFVPPSQAHPDATEAIDKVLLKCLATDPNARFRNPDEVRSALLPTVSHAPEVQELDDLQVEVDISLSITPSAPAAAPPRVPGVPDIPTAPGVPKAPGIPDRAPDVPNVPAVGMRVSMHEPFRPSLAEVVAESPQTSARTSADQVDLGEALASITENDAPRWMFVKNNLDHGPFSGRELVDLIVKGEIREEHGLLNMDTGARKSLREWPEFEQFVKQYELRKADEDHKAAVARTEKVEKRTGFAKITIAAAILAALGIGGGVFFLTRENDANEETQEAKLDDLYELGEIEITGSAGLLPDRTGPRRGRRKRSRATGGGRAAGRGGLSYEDAMNQGIELGDVTKADNATRLTPNQVASVMNKHVNRIYRQCVPAELRRGGNLSQVQIDIAIAGNGSVLGASARQGSAQFRGCIGKATRSVRFPSFGAPRMGARYRFAVE